MITPEMIEAAKKLVARADSILRTDAAGNKFRMVFADDLSTLEAALALHKPAMPEIRCDECDNGVEKVWEYCPWCGSKGFAKLPDKPAMPGEIEGLIAEAKHEYESGHGLSVLFGNLAAALRSLAAENERLLNCYRRARTGRTEALDELDKTARANFQHHERIAELEADLAAAKAKPLAMPEGLPEGPWVAVPDYHNGWTVITDDGQGTTVAAKLREDIARAIASLPALYAELAKAVAMADELWVAREQIRGELDAARNKTIEECVALAETMGDALTAEELAYEIRALATGETKPSEESKP